MIRILAALGWLAFAAIVVAGGRMMLGACEVRTWPVLDYAYCPVPPRQDRSGLDAERDRSAVLQSRVRRTEQQLAALPVCQPPAPPPPPEPEKRAEAPPPPPPPAPPPPDQMMIPTRLEDLKGCWQSERGDINIVSDDEREVLMGVVRICYCFDDDGKGTITQTFKGGGICKGTLRVQLSPNELKMHHPILRCSQGKGRINASNITCTGAQGQTAVCGSVSLGRMKGRGISGEHFNKVSDAACEWREN